MVPRDPNFVVDDHEGFENFVDSAVLKAGIDLVAAEIVVLFGPLFGVDLRLLVEFPVLDELLLLFGGD